MSCRENGWSLFHWARGCQILGGLFPPQSEYWGGGGLHPLPPPPPPHRLLRPWCILFINHTFETSLGLALLSKVLLINHIFEASLTKDFGNSVVYMCIHEYPRLVLHFGFTVLIIKPIVRVFAEKSGYELLRFLGCMTNGVEIVKQTSCTARFTYRLHTKGECNQARGVQSACTMTTQNSKIRLISSIALKSRLITYTYQHEIEQFDWPIRTSHSTT